MQRGKVHRSTPTGAEHLEALRSALRDEHGQPLTDARICELGLAALRVLTLPGGADVPPEVAEAFDRAGKGWVGGYDSARIDTMGLRDAFPGAAPGTVVSFAVEALAGMVETLAAAGKLRETTEVSAHDLLRKFLGAANGIVYTAATETRKLRIEA